MPVFRSLCFAGIGTLDCSQRVLHLTRSLSAYVHLEPSLSQSVCLCKRGTSRTCALCLQLGKVIGGGLPVGAYGGRREIMQMVAPAGKTTLDDDVCSYRSKVKQALSGLPEVGKSPCDVSIRHDLRMSW